MMTEEKFDGYEFYTSQCQTTSAMNEKSISIRQVEQPVKSKHFIRIFNMISKQESIIFIVVVKQRIQKLIQQP
jgi:hypothetical protein